MQLLSDYLFSFGVFHLFTFLDCLKHAYFSHFSLTVLHTAVLRPCLYYQDDFQLHLTRYEQLNFN